MGGELASPAVAGGDEGELSAVREPVEVEVLFFGVEGCGAGFEDARDECEGRRPGANDYQVIEGLGVAIEAGALRDW